VEAAVCVDCFGIAAAPVDTKLLLWLVSKDALPEGLDLRTAQHIVEKHLKATESEDFFHGSRKEIDDWSPKSWPQVAKVPSPILAPPPIEMPGSPGESAAMAKAPAKDVAPKDVVKDIKKHEPVKAPEMGKKGPPPAPAPVKKK